METTGTLEWNADAQDCARCQHDEAFSAHRGVVEWGATYVIFGNDGFLQDHRTRAQVSILKQKLQDAGIAELGFGLDMRSEDEADRGYTWALVTDQTAPYGDGLDDPKEDARRQLVQLLREAFLESRTQD